MQANSETSTKSSHSVPPLSIGHIMLWTAVSAVLFSVNVSGSWWSNVSQRYSVVYQTWESVFATFTAASIVGVFVLVMNRDSQARVFRASGHWLLLVFSVSTLPQLLSRAFIGSSVSEWWFVVVCVPTLASIATSSGAAYYNGGRWRWIFGAVAFTNIVMAAHYVGFFIGFSIVPGNFVLIQFVLPTLLLLAALLGLQEFLKRKSSDWLHVLGCVVTLASVASTAFWYLARQFYG